jgi:hypothetical protein
VYKCQDVLNTTRRFRQYGQCLLTEDVTDVQYGVCWIELAVSNLRTLSVAYLDEVKFCDGQWVPTWEGKEKKWPWPILRHCLAVCLDKMTTATRCHWRQQAAWHVLLFSLSVRQRQLRYLRSITHIPASSTQKLKVAEEFLALRSCIFLLPHKRNVAASSTSLKMQNFELD